MVKLINIIMKKILINIIFILVLTKSSYANDIKSFEIAGISIGERLLNHYSEKVIKDKIKNGYFYKGNKYVDVFFSVNDKSSGYETLQITINPEDKNFIIESVAGQIEYKNNMKECMKKKKIIVSELESFFDKKFENNYGAHAIDKSGESKVDQSMLFIQGSPVRVECYDWSKKYTYTDKLLISIQSEKFEQFLKNAY